MNQACKFVLGTVVLTCSLSPAQSQDTGLASVVGMPAPTRAEVLNDAWNMLQDGVTAKRADTRVDALGALSLLSGNPKAEQMVRAAMNDTNIDVRLAAIVAAGQMDKTRPGHPGFRTELHSLLASDDPKVSFAAASTLWSLHDTSGQDVLIATAEGERASDYSFLKRSERNANRTLHNPEALAKIAMTQGLVILVPPVGMGMGAYNYLKGTPGASPQVSAVVQLASAHTPEVQEALIEASRTKDPGARIAAAEALANFPGPEVQNALSALLTDDKLQVRLTASAAYIRNASGLTEKRAEKPFRKRR